jgi:hypothetical protein
MKCLYLMFSAIILLSVTSPDVRAADEKDTEGVEKQAFFMKTGQDLVDLCSLAREHPLHDKAVAFCYGYASGAMSFYGAISKSPKVPRIICSDKIISRAEMVQVFLDWAKLNPALLTEPPIDSLVRSAVAKWPCPKE